MKNGRAMRQLRRRLFWETAGWRLFEPWFYRARAVDAIRRCLMIIGSTVKRRTKTDLRQKRPR